MCKSAFTRPCAFVGLRANACVLKVFGIKLAAVWAHGHIVFSAASQSRSRV